MPETRVDTRIVIGARCTWWDSIYKASTAQVIPTCPHCGSPLYEYPDEAAFFKNVPAFEADGHPGYEGMLKWSKGRCYKNIIKCAEAYEKATGIHVPLEK